MTALNGVARTLAAQRRTSVTRTRMSRTWLRYGLLGVVLLGLAMTMGTSATRAAAEESGQAPTLHTLRGNSDGRASVVLGPVPLRAGLVVLRARAAGSSLFTVDLAVAPPGRSPLTDYTFSRLVINSSARYDGAVATLLPSDNDYYVIVSNTGAFEIDLEQPVPTNVTPVDARTFTGVADGVTPVFALPAGTYTVHVTSAATARLFAWLYLVDDLGGGTVFDSADGRFLQQLTGPFDETVTFTLRRPGLVLVSINADSYEPMQDPPTWTIAVD